jgi:CHASE3 domain sensor protein
MFRCQRNTVLIGIISPEATGFVLISGSCLMYSVVTFFFINRLRMAQEVQRQLEELEVKQRELEERGVSVEKALRGEGMGKYIFF